jgi:tetratricopeptide (TPR) repeat protein
LRKSLLVLPVDRVSRNLQAEYDFADTLQAVCLLLASCQNDPSKDGLREVAAAYELVSKLAWEEDFEEHADILSRLAFIGWNHCRRFRTYTEMGDWKGRCIAHALVPEQVRNFLAVPFAERSGELNERFLGDPVVLLAACDRQTRDPNRSPGAISREGERLYDWISKRRRSETLDGETTEHLLGTLALASATAARHLGQSREWNRWFRRARARLTKTSGAAPFLLELEFERLARLHVTRSYEVVAKHIGKLIARFIELSMKDKEIRARFLQAVNLKELGYNSEALACFTQLRDDASLRGDHMIMSLSLAQEAQIHGIAGQFERAITQALAAAPFAARSGCLWVAAELEASIGEVLRDRGQYAAAICAYQSAILKCANLEMDTVTAYLRVLLAETMLLAGSAREAVAEILAALPVIERESLDREARAVIGLIRGAIRRQQVGPEKLRELIERLRRMR